MHSRKPFGIVFYLKWEIQLLITKSKRNSVVVRWSADYIFNVCYLHYRPFRWKDYSNNKQSNDDNQDNFTAYKE